jgi:hypothetical protein
MLRNGEQIGLVSFEKGKEGGKQRRLARSPPELICPDSGQIEEPLRPTLVRERCR